MPLTEFHAYQPSARTLADAAGHIRILCAVCGGFANAWRHRSAEALATAAAKRAGLRRSTTLPPSPRPVLATKPLEDLRPKATAPRIADWRLTLLRLAIEQALEAEISLALRLRLTEAQRSLRSDLYGTISHELPATAHGRPDVEPKAPTHLAPTQPAAARADPSPTKDRASAARQAARAFRGDKHRALFLRAIDAGWTFDLLGSGHMRVTSPVGNTVVISTSATADRGHGFRNLKATAKRAGLDVDGL